MHTPMTTETETTKLQGPVWNCARGYYALEGTWYRIMRVAGKYNLYLEGFEDVVIARWSCLLNLQLKAEKMCGLFTEV